VFDGVRDGRLLSDLKACLNPYIPHPNAKTPNPNP